MVPTIRSVRVTVCVCAAAATFVGCSAGADSQVRSADSLAPVPTVAAVTTVATTTVAPLTTAETTVAPTQPENTAPTSPATATPVTEVSPTTVEGTEPTGGSDDGAGPASSGGTVQVQGIDVPDLGAGTTPHAVPTRQSASFGDGHNYPAVDIFVDGGCGGDVTAPVNGTIVEVRRQDDYDESIDNPATRGGKSVAMVGDDGVRYYMSHLDSIASSVEPGTRVELGEVLGVVGTTGRSGACHIHFGISPACQNKEWSIRRGVIGPMPYLESWRDGGQASPVEAVQQYLAENPDACAAAEADPNAADG